MHHLSLGSPEGALKNLFLIPRTVSYTHLDVYKRQEVNAAMKAASTESFGYTEEPLVSSDIIGINYGSLFDACLLYTSYYR